MLHHSRMIDAIEIKGDLDKLKNLVQAKRYAAELFEQLKTTIDTQQEKIDTLLFELQNLKRWRFGKKSESMDANKGAALDKKTEQAIVQEAHAEDRAAQAARKNKSKSAVKKTPKRQPLPSQLKRVEHHYKVEQTHCDQGHELKFMGHEISEQLDCEPVVFFVHRHIRDNYCCPTCNTMVTATLPAQVIDKGIAAPGLLAMVIIAKFEDHLPLYRQEAIGRRSGVNLARSSMASWIGECGVQLEPLAQLLREHVFKQSVVHGDETPVKLLMPGSGKTHTAYSWAYRTSDLETKERAVLFDFCMSRAGQNARDMLQDYKGTLVVDDYSGYKASFTSGEVLEAGCWAHVRRKFFEAHEHTQSEIAHEAVQRIRKLYDIEEQVRECEPPERLRLRKEHSEPLLKDLKTWLQEQRAKLADADKTAKAINYALNRWEALERHINDAAVPIDNNAVENAIRPIALGRKNWLFVGSQEAGERAATLMSLIESVKLNGHDSWTYLKDILTKLPTWPNSRLEELLPHRWMPPSTEGI